MTAGVASYIVCRGGSDLVLLGLLQQIKRKALGDCVRVRKTIRVFKSTKCIGA